MAVCPKVKLPGLGNPYASDAGVTAEMPSPGSGGRDRLRGLVYNIMRFAINDGPGIRTTVFLKGCPLACAWCHNPESQSPLPELAGRWVEAAEVIAEVRRDTVFYDQSGGGVTFSGGEPLAQPEFLLELLDRSAQYGLHTAVDTSGYAPWPALEEVSGLARLFLYDIKLMDTALHRRWTGVGNELILDNLAKLSAKHDAVTVRMPVVPGVNDDDDHARQVAAFLRSHTRVRQVVLLGYHPTGEAKYARLGLPYRMQGCLPPPPGTLERLAAIYAAAGFEPQVGG